MSLTEHQVLYNSGDEIRYAYFITNGLASLLTTTTEGESVEVGNVGSEGMVGIPIVLRQPKTPYDIVVQVAGDAWLVNADILRQEFEKDGELKAKLLAYTYALLTYISQLSACNHFHSLEKRLCRWLLTTSLQVHSKDFHLTHESLSQVLGTSRTAITMAVNKLEKEGLLQHHRSQITILNRAGIEAISCACYQLTKDVFRNPPELNTEKPTNQ